MIGLVCNIRGLDRSLVFACTLWTMLVRALGLNEALFLTSVEHACICQIFFDKEYLVYA